MRLLCRQLNDGEQSGDAFEIAVADGYSPEEYLEAKVASHLRGGWDVERGEDGVVHAGKDYPDSPEGSVKRKDRYMWLEP